MVWYGMDTCYSASAPCVIQLHMSVKSRWKLINGQGLAIGKQCTDAMKQNDSFQLNEYNQDH